MKKSNEEIENCLFSDLGNCLMEIESGNLTKACMLYYFSDFLLDANVDSKIIVNVLEQFGEDGEDAARRIKVEEGW